MYYAAIGVISIIIHLILTRVYLRNKEEKTEVNRAFKFYVWAALAYYISDAFWGIIYDMHVPMLLYIDTVLYYVAMAMTVVLLCKYVTAYLQLDTKFGKFVNYFGLLFGIIEIATLFINHFVHIFFWIDSEGVYHAYIVRYVALYMQVILCVLLAIETGYAMTKALGGMKKRYFTVFLFCVEMTAAIVMQIVFPLLPIYSVGLLIGIVIIHTFVEEGELEEQYKVLLSLSDIFYSMHVIDLTSDTVEEFNAKNDVKEIVNHRNGAVEMMRQVMSQLISDEYREAALEFTELTTLADRMRGKQAIDSQFVGMNTGWFSALFVAIETDREERPTKVIYATRVIEEEKRFEEKLIFQSHTDELTSLYNRRAYEDDVYELQAIPNEFVYFALDVNGLKVVNDTIGHAAGDELIIGASECIRKGLGAYGKVYRTGGDEFVAIVYVEEDKLKDILQEFDDIIENWSGKLVDRLSISYGYVTREEHPDYAVPQFATEADKRMYAAKSVYYRKKGVDRRGQQDAHRVLCETYTKILKINLTDDSYQIISMPEDEKDAGKGFTDNISTWLQEFGRSGHVHPDDLDEYLEKTEINFMKNYFKAGNTANIIQYRRKFGDVYKHVMMEMIPTKDYADDNQSLYLYVKSIER